MVLRPPRCITIVFISCLFVNIAIIFSVDENIKTATSRCELNALRLGSDLVDAFNAPIGNENWDERVNQDFIAENLGFAPWLLNGAHKSGKTLTGNNVRDLQFKGGWTGRDIAESSYKVLDHKWVYMLGDSTTRQVWASYAAPFQGNNFVRNAKEWSRQYCSKQNGRLLHAKGGSFPREGWRGPCGVNEVTCHVSGYGDHGLLSYDWKHFPYEDYDDYLWGASGPWAKGFFSERRTPHVLTIQLGLHTCWHTHPEGLYSTDLQSVNSSMLTNHIQDIYKLMTAVRKAVLLSNNNPLSLNGTKTVIVLTSGSTGMPNSSRIDECILRVNRHAAEAAHANGFAVLERGEIERRLMFKSVHAEAPNLPVEMHLMQPAQNIVATCLLRLMECLEPLRLGERLSNVSEVLGAGRGNSKHWSSQAKPLHRPP